MGHLRLAIQSFSNLVKVEIENAAELIDLYRNFQQGKTRFMLAFRHPSVVDPPCLAQVLWNQLSVIAKQQGATLRSPIHAHFILTYYDFRKF